MQLIYCRHLSLSFFLSSDKVIQHSAAKYLEERANLKPEKKIHIFFFFAVVPRTRKKNGFCFDNIYTNEL